MQREIEFRGKHTGSWNDWVVGSLTAWKDGTRTIFAEEYASLPGKGFFNIIPETVGQYTGLRDIGGVKIFEGDIALYDGKKH